MPTDDFSNYRRRYRNALDRLEEADIDERDRDAITRWLRARDGDLAASSLAQYATRLYRLAERSETPLVDLDIEGVRELCFELRNGDDRLSDATVYNYQAALHAWASHHGADWVDEFDPDKPTVQQRTVDEQDMLSQEDIAALIDACKRPRNQALIDFLADTGARLTLTGSLRVRDVDLDGERATYRPNPNAIGLKGAPIQPYPIIDAKASLRVYLRHSHPRPDEPDAALFHRFEAYDEDVDVDDGALSPDRVRKVIREVADRAGVEKPVRPHNFKHSAITRMWREGWDKQEIQHRVHWSLDTNMWDRYVHVSAEEMNEQIFASAGIGETEDALDQTRAACGNCRETVAPHAEWCPNCGEPQSPDARDQHNERIGSHADGAVSVADLSRRQVRAELIKVLNEHPDWPHES